MPPPGRNLEEELVFYGCYHSRPGNQLVHFLFVPPIMFTLCVWLAYLPAPAAYLPTPAWVPAWVTAGAVLNPALALVAAYAVYYTLLEPVAGGTWALAQGLPMWLGATAWRAARPDAAWKVAAAVHAAAWVIQVGVGHGLIERRRPALTVSLGQALGTAALFAWLEFLFHAGYRPDLKARLDARVVAGQAAMDRRAGLRGGTGGRASSGWQRG
jgi:uncharacterized membrane protein YGL010W